MDAPITKLALLDTGYGMPFKISEVATIGNKIHLVSLKASQ